MKKELKEQIKQDELASGLEQAAGWVRAHSEGLRISVGVLVAVGAAIGGIAYFQARRAAEADRAFRDALRTYDAPVRAALPPGAPAPEGLAFATAEEKYKTAAAAFEGVERRFGSSTLGLRAKYYGALCRIELKQFTEAEKALTEIQQRDAGLESELARMALADSYRRGGLVDKALETYRALASGTTVAVPRDLALLQAAKTLEDARRWREAAIAYRDLAEQFPASASAAEARNRAEYLKSALQG